MALSDYQKKVIQAGASAYWPLDDPSGTVARDLAGTPIEPEGPVAIVGVITVNGVDITHHVQYGTLRVGLALNEAPDTASFDVLLTSAEVDSGLYPTANVLITLDGDPIFGGQILTMQTTRRPGHVPTGRSVMCADYLQVLDSEYLVTYGWPAQSATATIYDLVERFTGKGGVVITTTQVAAGLPSLAAFAVSNERFSTVLRRIVTQFPTGGGFYVDPLKVLHVWEGASEPGTNPAPVTLASPQLKTFAETMDNAQQRDAVIVEGVRTTAPIGTPGPDPLLSPNSIASIPVVDASILDPITDLGGGLTREVRIGTQRFKVGRAEGVWSAPAGTPQTTYVTTAVAFNPDPGVESNTVTIYIQAIACFTGRTNPWVKVDEQWLKVLSFGTLPVAQMVVPRTGYGAVVGAIAAEAVVSVADSFSGISVTDRYNKPGVQEQVRPQPIDAEVVMTVRSASGYAIHEQIVQDGRFSRSGAAARGQQEVQDFSQALISIQFETDDLAAKPGRLQAYNLAEPVVTPLVGEYMILTAELTWPVWGQAPRRVCTAAEVHPANVIDAWLVDRR